VSDAYLEHRARVVALYHLEVDLRDKITREAQAAARWANAPITRQDLASLAILARGIRRESLDRYEAAYVEALRWGDVT
jgi:hypothetical protein